MSEDKWFNEAQELNKIIEDKDAQIARMRKALESSIMDQSQMAERLFRAQGSRLADPLRKTHYLEACKRIEINLLALKEFGEE